MRHGVGGALLLGRLLEELDLRTGWVEPLRLPPEVDLHVHVLHQEVGEEARLRRSRRHVVERDAHELSVLRVGDRALLEVADAADDVARGEGAAVVLEGVVVRLLAGASPAPAIHGVAEEQRRQRRREAAPQDVLVLGLGLRHLDGAVLQNLHLVHVDALLDAVVAPDALPQVLEAIVVQAPDTQAVPLDPRIQVGVVRVEEHPWLLRLLLGRGHGTVVGGRSQPPLAPPRRWGGL
mmetsp:Transcript_14894/g.38250  ORF Transcript_14894/g.38250 Transcript_14894/m.38250 type:complete len:236 (+) Transcript_14894:1158-1865(+)